MHSPGNLPIPSPPWFNHPGRSRKIICSDQGEETGGEGSRYPGFDSKLVIHLQLLFTVLHFSIYRVCANICNFYFCDAIIDL
jgi:hypothetical protein